MVDVHERFYSIALRYAERPNSQAERILQAAGVEYFARQSESGEETVVVRTFNCDLEDGKYTMFRLPSDASRLEAHLLEVKKICKRPCTKEAIDGEDNVSLPPYKNPNQ